MIIKLIYLQLHIQQSDQTSRFYLILHVREGRPLAPKWAEVRRLGAKGRPSQWHRGYLPPPPGLCQTCFFLIQCMISLFSRLVVHFFHISLNPTTYLNLICLAWIHFHTYVLTLLWSISPFNVRLVHLVSQRFTRWFLDLVKVSI